MLTLAVIVSLVSCAAFSVAYLYFLGLRIIRTSFDDKQSALLTGFIVCSGILAATVSLEAVVLISVVREVSGRLFYAASGIGIVALALGTAGVAGYPKPIEIALAHHRVAKWCIDPLNSCTGVIVEGNDDEYPDGRRYQALDGQA